MLQKSLIAILVLALLGVSGAWGYSEWNRRQPPAKAAHHVVAPPPGTPAPAPEVLEPPQDSAAAQADGTRFEIEYVPPQDPALEDAYHFAQKVELYTRMPEVMGLSGMFVMPRPLKLVTAECQQTNAFYAKDKGEVVLCYEMIDTILKYASQIAEEKGYDADFTVEYLFANLRFIMLHEMGHALIDTLDLSVTGREEDAADQLATTLMLLPGASDDTPEDTARHLQMAATFFLAGSNPEGGYDLGTYADEHSLGEQRYYNVLCLLYGRDPGRYLRVVTRSGLPEERAMRCPDESKRVTSSWARLLTPHFASQYRKSDEENRQIAARAVEEQRRNAPTPYVRGEDTREEEPAPANVDDNADGDDNPYTR